MQRSGKNQEIRPPLPPFDEESARQKVKMAQAAWNTRDLEKVSLAHTEDSKWRNRDVDERFSSGAQPVVVLAHPVALRQSREGVRHDLAVR